MKVKLVAQMVWLSARERERNVKCVDRREKKNMRAHMFAVTHRRPPTISTKPYNASLVFEAVTRPPCNKYKTSSRKSRAWAPLSNKYERLKHNPRALERWKIPHRRSESSLNPKSILFLVGLRRTVILNISFCCYIILQPR